MLSNYTSIISRIIIWICFGIPILASAQGSLIRDIGTPISESGISAETRQVLRPRSQPQLFEHGNPNTSEQYLLELVNRARANPTAEAARFGIDLNQGLTPGTITNAPKPPLAFHWQLNNAARAHSQWMLDTDTFSHIGVGGSWPGHRMANAGYPFSGSWAWGENIALDSTAGTPHLKDMTISSYEGWFLSAGHRHNIMSPEYDEIGIGLVIGQFQTLNALAATENFARSDGTPGPLLVGVVYNDINGNNFYDVGEGVADVSVHVLGGAYYTVTSSSGGFAVPYDMGGGAGDIEVTFSGGALETPVQTTVVGTGENVKLDLQSSGNDSVTVLITHYYVSILRRDPEEGGMTYWRNRVVERLEQGVDVKPVFRDIAHYFFNSPEYLGRNTDNEEFITNLYLTFFQREPDANGYAYWSAQLSGGMSRNEAMFHFLFSPEFTAFMEELGF